MVDFIMTNVINFAGYAVSAALITLLIMMLSRRLFRSDITIFYSYTAIVISFSLLIASAAFNSAFTYMLLNPIMFYGITIAGTIIMGMLNVGAFFIDMSLAKAIKAKQKTNAGILVGIRLGILLYSILSAATVFNSSQAHIKKMQADADIQIEILAVDNELAELNANVAANKILAESTDPLKNIRGDVVSMSNCHSKAHSFYLAQEVCQNYLNATSDGAANVKQLEKDNLLKEYEISAAKPVEMKPIMGVDTQTIFILIAFLLDTVSFALVMFVEFYNNPQPKCPPRNHSPIPLKTKAVSTGQVREEKGLTAIAESARLTIPTDTEITDSNISDLLIDIHKNNPDKPLPVSKVSSIIKERIGYSLNKNRIIDAMQDSPVITKKIERGQEAYYTRKENEANEFTPVLRQSKTDRGTRQSSNVRGGMSSDI